MSDLTKILARWDKMTPRERAVQIARYIMGWEYHSRFCGQSDCWIIPGQKVVERFASEWNPTTDHNDKAEAVRAFCKVPNDPAVRSAGAMLYGRITEGLPTILSAILLNPSDVCFALLQALAESEGK